ncbi:MAG: hypothetical protein FJ278_25445, partial [Planctomycetes bacterium]|nr:hypothetical protein [Planctomycetota bacterium]
MKPTSGLNILPKPQKVTLHSGSVPRSRFRTLAVSGPLSAALMKHVRQFAQRYELALSAGEGAESHSCATVRFEPSPCPMGPQGSILIRVNPAASVQHPEGYVLRVGEQTVLDAAEERGLFYGLQTLHQLLDRATAIPRCTIEDWPALALRGFYFDLTRQVPTTDFLRRIVDRLAAVKINLLMIQYREFFPYEGFPLIVSEAAYTRKEFADFVRYAAERHVQVAPLLQSLSFQEHILRAQAYAHLR